MPRARSCSVPSLLLLSLLTSVAGCHNESAPPGENDSDPTGSEAGGIGSLSQTGGQAEGSSSGGFGDSSEESSSGSVTQLSCNKIDFVFVIDNSSSMADEQQYLVSAVPGFVEAMRTALPNVDSFQVGVIDTDSYPGLGTTEDPLAGCPAEGVDCGACQYTLGAFVDKPNSGIDPDASCNFSTGVPYMAGEAESFPEEFACAAIVGTQGNPVEQQIGALQAALDPELQAEGACNAGFTRDDALLVFLVISDEEDDHTLPPAPQGGSLGEPNDWYQAIVAAKQGRPSNVVALGLIGGSPRFPDCTALSSDGNGAEQTTRVQQFLRLFDTHFEGSVCHEGYAEFFDEALQTVAQGCMNFIP